MKISAAIISPVDPLFNTSVPYGSNHRCKSATRYSSMRFVSENIPVSVFLPAWWSVILGGGAGIAADVNNAPIAVTKIPGGKYLKVVEAIKQSCGRPSKKDIQTAVATREGKKAYKAMLGWQGSDGRELPAEFALNIAKLTAAKKIDGGKKKTRKTKKAKKSTRRR